MAKPQPKGPYEVGFGKPPVDCQFAKGQSGNPKGRPKKRVDASPESVPIDSTQEILAHARKSVILRTTDGETTVSALSAVLQATLARATKGVSAAQKIYIETVARAERIDEERWANLRKHVNHLNDHHKFIVAEIEREGLSDEVFVPHPGDIALNFETRDIDVHGPYDWETFYGMQDVIAARGQLAWPLWAWNEIKCESELRRYIRERIAARWNSLHIFDRFLPPRFQLPPLADYLLDPPQVEPAVGDSIIFGIIAPIPSHIARLFLADPAAERAFFDGTYFLSGNGLIDDPYSPYYRPIGKRKITREERNSIETKLARATTAAKHRKVLRAIARDKSLPPYVNFNAQQSVLRGDFDDTEWKIEHFRKSLY